MFICGKETLTTSCQTSCFFTGRWSRQETLPAITKYFQGRFQVLRRLSGESSPRSEEIPWTDFRPGALWCPLCCCQLSSAENSSPVFIQLLQRRCWTNTHDIFTFTDSQADSWSGFLFYLMIIVTAFEEENSWTDWNKQDYLTTQADLFFPLVWEQIRFDESVAD